MNDAERLASIVAELRECNEPLLDLRTVINAEGVDTSTWECARIELDTLTRLIRGVTIDIDEVIASVARVEPTPTASPETSPETVERDTAAHALECIDRAHIALGKAVTCLLAPNDTSGSTDAVLAALAAVSDARCDVAQLAEHPQ